MIVLLLLMGLLFPFSAVGLRYGLDLRDRYGEQ